LLDKRRFRRGQTRHGCLQAHISTRTPRRRGCLWEDGWPRGPVPPILKTGANMYPLKKGKTTSQAHVGLPEGTFEEEHGRKGFYGKSAHLYHAHPPTGWIRFEGKLRPHCFDLNELKPGDLADAEGMPVAFLGNDDVRLYVSRRSEPMPFYYRNADGDELYF